MFRRQTKIRRILKDRRRELRKKATEAESVLWQLLKKLREQKLIFRRQHSVGPYIADFCCPAKKLIIEIDGKIHDLTTQRAYDEERTKYLIAAGYRVLRFKNDNVFNHPQQVVRNIIDNCSESPSPASVEEGLG